MPAKKATTKAAKQTPAKTSKAEPARTVQADARVRAGKVSALDAAVKVLSEAKQPMNCKAMIEAMAAQRYWKSPGGKTPQATLYASILKEITTKGKQSRFVKVDRGQFALAGK